MDDLRVLTDEQADLFCEVGSFITDHAMHAEEDAQAERERQQTLSSFFKA